MGANDSALGALAREIRAVNAQNGWEAPRSLRTEAPLLVLKLSLVASEIAEALELVRRGRLEEPDGRESFYEELADIAIRLLDLAAGMGLEDRLASPMIIVTPFGYWWAPPAGLFDQLPSVLPVEATRRAREVAWSLAMLLAAVGGMIDIARVECHTPEEDDCEGGVAEMHLVRSIQRCLDELDRLGRFLGAELFAPHGPIRRKLEANRQRGYRHGNRLL